MVLGHSSHFLTEPRGNYFDYRHIKRVVTDAATQHKMKER